MTSLSIYDMIQPSRTGRYGQMNIPCPGGRIFPDLPNAGCENEEPHDIRLHTQKTLIDVDEDCIRCGGSGGLGGVNKGLTCPSCWGDGICSALENSETRSEGHFEYQGTGLWSRV